MAKFESQLQDMAHDPNAGIWGDCHRTACAMVLGIDKTLIPNFYNELIGNHALANEKYSEFFLGLGLTQIQIAIPGDDVSFSTITESREAQSPGTPYVVGVAGSQGVNHSVAIKDGFVFDPMGREATRYFPCNDGFYWITYFGLADPASFLSRNHQQRMISDV